MSWHMALKKIQFVIQFLNVKSILATNSFQKYWSLQTSLFNWSNSARKHVNFYQGSCHTTEVCERQWLITVLSLRIYSSL